MKVVVSVTALLWAIESVDWVLGGALDSLGVQPWTTQGLVGIVFAPFLHGDFSHLLANTLGLIPLGLLTMARKQQDFWVVTVFTAITAGLGAWVFGSLDSVHIGASGVVFGYLGFLLGRGWYDRRPGPVALSILVAWLFGGMVWGVLPSGLPISWQSHLFGFLGGMFMARTLGKGINASRG